MAKTKKNSISVDGISFHRGELARFKSADEMVAAFKEDKTYGHIFEQDGGENALREAYGKAAPVKEVASNEVTGDGTGTALPENEDQSAPTKNGRKKLQ